MAAARRLPGQLIARLAQAREIRIEAEGTDLRLQVGGRTWVNSDGKRNMPSGEVFTGPREDGVDGVLRSTVRSAPAGVDVEGVELELRGGEVVRATAARGQEYLTARWPPTTAPGASASSASARTSASTGPIGTILFDEKLGGTVHVALGRSYPETGGRTGRPCTGTSSATCAAAGGSRPTARSCSRAGASSRSSGRSPRIPRRKCGNPADVRPPAAAYGPARQPHRRQ